MGFDRGFYVKVYNFFVQIMDFFVLVAYNILKICEEMVIWLEILQI